MLPETEIAWLAGIFDGEGSARIYRRKTGSCRFWVQVQPVSNTDFSLIERVAKDLKELGISYSLRTDNRSRKSSKPWHRHCSDMRISSRDSVQKFLSTILPYTTGTRKASAENVLAFISVTRKEGRAGWVMPEGQYERDEKLYLAQSFRACPTNGQVIQ